ncbi:MAG: S8 family serine peptidase [Pyrinomonadaceae bacterium]
MLEKNSQLRAILTALVVVAIAAVVLSRALTAPASAGVSTVSVIVELRDEPGAVYKARTEKSGGTVSQDQLRAYRDGLTAKQDAFLASLAGKGISATIVSRDVKNYDGNIAATVPLRYSLVYNGMAMKVNQDSITALRNMPEVKSVHADETLITSLNNSVSYIGAPKVYGNAAELTQFDTLNEGYEGQGMYVSIIDTGIDWTHPMFGGDPTPPRLAVMPAGPTQGKTNQKVVYYLPLTDLAVEDGFGHGTHVAATVAGYLAQTLDGVRLHGVAPQAKLMSYKVCSDIKSTVSQVQPIGGCESSDTMMALEDSVSPFTLNNPMLPKPVAHVINMSLGGGGGPDNPTAVAASNAALMGTVVVASSGNSGPGEGTTGSPAAGTHVISVGANTHPGSAGSVWSVDVPGHSRMKLLPMQGSATPASPITAKYVYVDSATSPGLFPANVSGRIALIKDWTGTTFFDMSTQATAAGAVALVFIREDGANAVKTTIPSAVISTADGQAMINALSASDNDNPANGAISDNEIKLNGFLGGTFMGDMASFSSRGPVRGLGQIKPDISAPGVAVLAACPPASLLGALAAAANPTSPNYIAIDGTSMSSPHAAGAVTLIKQAHLNWSPDVIRTVLINTATNMRDQSGATKADGPDADSIIAQGGGLIDVPHAVKAKAAMGVTGDGISQPGILGSYSFGEVPVVNNRITHTAPITVTIRDLSGQGGTYNLNVANNRDLQLAGISVTTSQSSVSVPANGSATFTVNATFDGDQIRDVMAAKTVGTQVIFEKIQMQWFVTATGSNNESLRMPFFFRPGNSLPAQPNVQTLNQTATVPTGAYGVQVADGVTAVNVPFEVSASTFQIEADLEWFTRPTGSQEDIDYELLDPDGNVIASSGGPAGASESVKVRVNRGGTYVHRVLGFVNAATDVNITTKLTKGPDAPAVQTIPGDFVDSQSRNVDFDGSFTLNWTGVGGEQGYEVQQSSASNPDWQTIAAVDAGTTSYNLTNLANDTYSFRVRGIHPGQIGKFVTNAGNEISVLVDQRSKVDITNLVTQAISNVSLSGGVFQLDLAMTSNSTQTYIPHVDLNVIGVNSASGTVKIINADNGKDGKSAANAALFSYSQKLGADQLFSPAEISSPRSMRFEDNTAEMFTFDVVVTAYLPNGTGGAGTQGAAAPPPSGGGSDSGLTGQLPLTKVTAVMRFTANPLTKKVTASLVTLR